MTAVPTVALTIVTSSGFDLHGLYDEISQAVPYSVSATDFFAANAATGHTFHLVGTGFTFGPLGFTGGTINEINFINTADGKILVTETGFALDASAVGSAVTAIQVSNDPTLLTAILDQYAIVARGSVGDDTIPGFAQADSFSGHAGRNIVDYSHSAAGITASLADPSQNTGNAAGDSYTNISGFIGTDFADVLTGDARGNSLDGGAGADTLTGGGGGGRDMLIGGAGDDTFVINKHDVVAGETYDGGAGDDTILLADAPSADFSSDTLTGVEHFVGSSGNDWIILSLAQLGAFDTIDGAGGIDTVWVRIGGTVDVTAGKDPALPNVESIDVVGSTGDDALTQRWAQFTAVHVIDLSGGTDTINVVVAPGETTGAARFPTLRGIEALNLLGTGEVTLTIAELNEFSSIAAGLAVTLADSGARLATLTATEIGQLASRGVDIIDATNDRLSLSVAQVSALGPVALTQSDTVTLVDVGAAIAAPTPDQILAGAALGIDRSDATDNQYSVTVAQYLASVGAITLTQWDVVTIADSGADIAALSDAQVAALAGNGIDKIDATDDALTLTAAQYLALGKVKLSPTDALTLTGTPGDDRFTFGADFNSADHLDGLAGTNRLTLRGDYSSGLVFNDTTLVSFASISAVAGFSYDLTLADGNVNPGGTMVVAAPSLGALSFLIFDGSAETNGRFAVTGGAGDDSFTGGSGADRFTGAGGSDVVRYAAAAQSTGATYDTVVGFDANVDKFSVWSGVTGVDAPITAGTLSTATFDANLAAGVNATNLLANHAALFTAHGGSLLGSTFLVVDTNGVAGYQASADLVVRLTGASSLGSFGTGNFVS